MPSVAQPSPVETTTINLCVMGPRSAVGLGISPASLQNTTNTRLAVLISGGTVTTIEFSRDNVVFDLVGLLGDNFYLIQAIG